MNWDNCADEELIRWLDTKLQNRRLMRRIKNTFDECEEYRRKLAEALYDNADMESDSRLVQTIWDLLNGKDWSPDTLDAIASAMGDAGYEIRGPE